MTSPLAMTPGSSSGCSAGRLARTPSSAGALEKFPSVASDEGRFGEGSVGGATAEFTDAASPANAVAGAISTDACSVLVVVLSCVACVHTVCRMFNITCGQTVGNDER